MDIYVIISDKSKFKKKSVALDGNELVAHILVKTNMIRKAY